MILLGFDSLTICLIWFICLLSINVAYLLLLILSECDMCILNLLKQWQRMCIFTDKTWRWIKWKDVTSFHAVASMKAGLISATFTSWLWILQRTNINYISMLCWLLWFLFLLFIFIIYSCHFYLMERVTKARLHFVIKTHVNLFSSYFLSNFHVYKS
jgi:hypothetical protein